MGIWLPQGASRGSRGSRSRMQAEVFRLFGVETDVLQKWVDQDRQPVFGGRRGLSTAKQPYKLGSSLYKTIWIRFFCVSPFGSTRYLPDGDYENLLVVIMCVTGA